jgi:hypothetical protein
LRNRVSSSRWAIVDPVSPDNGRGSGVLKCAGLCERGALRPITAVMKES